MDTKVAERNIRLYKAYLILREPILWGAILITYIKRVSGMTLAEIYTMEAVCVVIAAFFQIPTGSFADKHGRVTSMRIGLLFIIIEMSLFATANCRAMIWISNACWAIGMSFMSGADSAFLYDNLKVLGQGEKEYRHIVGRTLSIRLWFVAVCSIACGYIANINIRLPCLIDTVFVCMCLCVLLMLRECRFVEKDEQHEQNINMKWHMVTAVKEALRNKKVMWVILIATTLGVISKMWFFTYNPYFEAVKIPIQQFGYVFFALNVVAALSSRFSARIATAISSRTSATITMSCVAVPIVLMSLAMAPWAIWLVLPQNFVRGYTDPFIGGLMNRHVRSKNRATMLSIKSSIHQWTEVGCMAGFGYMVKTNGLQNALIGLGAIACLMLFVIIGTYKKMFHDNVPA